MRFTVDRKTLAAAAKSVIVAPVNTHISVLQGLHIEADRKAGVVTLTGSNIDFTFAVELDADVDNGGVTIIPAAKLVAFAANGPADTVTLELGDGSATLACGDAVATFRTFDVEHWPKAPNVEGVECTIPAPHMRRIGSVLYAAATDRTRPILTGVHLHGGRIAATDSYRLSVLGLAELDAPEMLVPPEILRRVVDHLGDDPVTVSASSRQIQFAVDRRTWTSNLLEGEFPNVANLVDGAKPTGTMRFLTDDLADALKRMAVVDATQEAVAFTPDGGKVILSRAEQDVGEVSEVVPASLDGDVVPIQFNRKYLSELLAAHGEQTVTLEVDGALKPALVRSADSRQVHLIMPIRAAV